MYVSFCYIPSFIFYCCHHTSTPLFTRSLSLLYIPSFSRFLNPIVGISRENVLARLFNLLFSFIVFHFIVTPVVWQNTRLKVCHIWHTHSVNNIVSYCHNDIHYDYYCAVVVATALMIKLNSAIQVFTHTLHAISSLYPIGNTALRIWKSSTDRISFNLVLIQLNWWLPFKSSHTQR